ncbi:MAG: hypothetical protein RLZZ360_533 [Candidatus Parcubacteria bacterium]|jgi:ribA/ribD-fused uncharacterized protein
MANTDHLFLGADCNPKDTAPINFVETRFNDLSPFSAHEIIVDGIVCKTVEHGYQALRIKLGPERDEVLAARSPMDAWRAGQKYKSNPSLQAEGYDKYVLMECLCRLKLEQHADVQAVLAATGKRELLKVYDTDYYWGTGADGSGENQLGKIWMKLRAELFT